MADEKESPSPERGPEEAKEPAAEPGAGSDASGTAQTPSELDRLKDSLAEAVKQAETYKDQLLRKAAEFENYKRRVEADYANLIRSANEGLILDLIPILDDFARSMKAAAENKEFEPFFKGVELIRTKLNKVLQSHGLASFDALGKPFDVAYHDALLLVPTRDHPPHTVIEEVERGYMLNDRVLRHAKVIVSSGADGGTREETESKVPDNGEQKAPKND